MLKESNKEQKSENQQMKKSIKPKINSLKIFIESTNCRADQDKTASIRNVRCGVTTDPIEIKG